MIMTFIVALSARIRLYAEAIVEARAMQRRYAAEHPEMMRYE